MSPLDEFLALPEREQFEAAAEAIGVPYTDIYRVERDRDGINTANVKITIATGTVYYIEIDEEAFEPDPVPERTPVEEMTAAELKTYAAELGLSKSGNKDAVYTRITEHLATADQ